MSRQIGFRDVFAWNMGVRRRRVIFQGDPGALDPNRDLPREGQRWRLSDEGWERWSFMDEAWRLAEIPVPTDLADITEVGMAFHQAADGTWVEITEPSTETPDVEWPDHEA